MGGQRPEISGSRTVEVVGSGPLIVTPGIRPAGVDAGDQHRVATPRQAVDNGADFLVIGRPITRADDPAAAIAAIRSLWPEHFAWKQPPYEYELEKLPIDILAGGDGMRLMIDDGVPAAEIRRQVWPDRPTGA